MQNEIFYLIFKIRNSTLKLKLDSCRFHAATTLFRGVKRNNGWCSLPILGVKCVDFIATGKKSKEKKCVRSGRRLCLTLNTNKSRVTASSKGRIFSKQYKLFTEEKRLGTEENFLKCEASYFVASEVKLNGSWKFSNK